ncbi:TPA: type II toxin-antitoxin system death-on-curing family toxin, partial [Streptococcus agalactiae]|nr:type II toxin-antitoxin system death-on-curing family toxin [Streptococcus agalactiae]HEM9599456.1 type II toxin-antitoxin system death-on-curing family toxin [Streptococcus agalactiae]HEM9636349.1 type II toxin-antitoxin system death-on-curing family toxin [Streptococcus agalactiae]
MKKLTSKQILFLHSQLISATGGIDGTRDKGLVESALANVFDTYFGVEKYKTIEEKSARLCYSLIKNHAFLDGNKR